MVDAEGRVAWMDPVLARAVGWEAQAAVGRAARQVLAVLPWLEHAVVAGLRGQEDACEGTGRGQRLRALVLPVFDGGRLMGVCARLHVVEPTQSQADGKEEVIHQLARAQQRFESIVDGIDGIVWEADADLHLTFLSRQSERLLGYPREQWLEEPDFWDRHVYPDDRAWARAYCLRALREQRSLEFEYRMFASDGRIVWLRAHVTVVTDDGQSPRLRGLLVDVTEQRLSHERLEQTHSILRAIFDSISDGVVVVDAAQRITAYNKRFQDMWGLSDAVMATHDADTALRAAAPLVKDAQGFVEGIEQRYFPTEEVDVRTVELVDGRVLECTSKPQRLGGTPIGRVWSYRDVTSERRSKIERERLLVAEQNAREQLEESFALIDTFLAHAPVGLAFLDQDLRYLRINDALAALHGRHRNEEMGHTVREMNPLMADTIEPRLREVMATGKAINGLEMSGYVPSTPDELRHWRVNYYPIRTPKVIVGVGVVVVEVTEEYRAQKERERLLREAQEAIRVRDDFLSIAAHELKTPLTPLKLHLQMMKQQAAAGRPPREHHVDKALAQVSRLAVLIHDLLDATRIQAGRLELKHEPVSLQALVRDVLAQNAAPGQGHTLEHEEPAEPLVVLGDPGRLAQVLTNLLENAFKYSPTGGAVRVTLERKGDEAVVSVRDQGIGIPEDQRTQLFERLFRARNAPISGFGGLGLGLYICRDIVERHGGRIWVDSELGQGSTFHFTLPLMT
ncbi:PAS domain-containing protein [Myxococcus sp. K15C18031901]|nr:PAS domain-containing protein [Myxococcus dinghuensis]